MSTTPAMPPIYLCRGSEARELALSVPRLLVLDVSHRVVKVRLDPFDLFFWGTCYRLLQCTRELREHLHRDLSSPEAADGSGRCADQCPGWAHDLTLRLLRCCGKQ